MKLKFKHQQYQEDAVNAVIDCFRGQPRDSIQKYRYDIGEIARKKKAEIEAEAGLKAFKDIKLEDFSDNAFKNSKIVLAEEQLLENIQTVQKKSGNLDFDKALVSNDVSKINLDIEMETGTGKTYCYIKTIFELNKNYGWSKFIIVVPSIAIREGVNKSFEITAEHFHQSYHKKIRYFIYDSDNLNELDSFSSSADINVMIINTQAFNSSLKKPQEGSKSKNNAARKIFSELDDFGSRRPINVIKANNPILIIDEPQKVEGDVKKSSKTFEALKEFNPLMILRYSATHKKKHNLIYRLDALDAYNQKLVKKIKVTGLSIQGLAATDSYLYLENFILSESAPKAMIEIEIKQKSGAIKRVRRSFSKGDNLFELSGKLAQYNDFVITEIDVNLGKLFFKNGVELELGAVIGDTNEETLRRIQIREAIKAHLEKEAGLFSRGIKVLSLFFIDEVAKYRLYDENSEKLSGDYAQVFEEEYQELVKEYLNDEDSAYIQYLKKIPVGETHKGYFSIDKNKRLVNPTIKNGDASPSDYDLIMKEKETLLSLDEPTRFIFSHSALREGWDNPNVFVICTLKQSSNDINRRQEVGRGLRICVNHDGFRQDDPNTVHQINELTVVSSGPYQEFVSSLQSDYKEIVAKRQRPLNKDYFLNKIVNISGIDIAIDDKIAKQIERYLVKNDYIDSDDIATDKLKEDIESKSLADFGELYEYKDVIVDLINNVLDASKVPDVDNGRKSDTNTINKKNFKKKEFLELWNRINHKAIYKVDFESQELIQKAVSVINKELQVKTLKYIIERGAQTESLSYEQLHTGEMIKANSSDFEEGEVDNLSDVRYDLLAEIADKANLTRSTVAEILTRISSEKFDMFQKNPEDFIHHCSRLIKEQKATMIVEKLSYDMLNEKYDLDEIFTKNQAKIDFSKMGDKLNKHVYDYVVTDSGAERKFVNKLDISEKVAVYSKLPKDFKIPTPIGDYNPDWAIAFEDGTVRHIYFVAETKGDMSTLQLRDSEKIKIECANKFFEKINSNIAGDKVKYCKVTSYDDLLSLVS